MADPRTPDDVRRDPRPLGWLFHRHHPKPGICPSCGRPSDDQEDGR